MGKKRVITSEERLAIKWFYSMPMREMLKHVDGVFENSYVVIFQVTIEKTIIAKLVNHNGELQFRKKVVPTELFIRSFKPLK